MRNDFKSEQLLAPLYLADAFNRLKKIFPLPDKAKPIGFGYHGLAIDNGDGTITKAVKNHGLSRRKHTAEDFENETMILKLLDGRRLGDVQTPSLVEEPIRFQPGNRNPDYYGLIRMKKLSGKTGEWDKFIDQATPEALKHRFEQAGAMVARFHAAARQFPQHKLQSHDWNASILVPNNVPDDIKHTLTLANDYYQAHKIPGVVHYDLAGRNILVSGNKITGLIDFTLCHKSTSIYDDMRHIPDNALAIDSFIKGYKDESGQELDPLMFRMTSIRDQAEWVLCLEENPPPGRPQSHEKACETLVTKLNNIKSELLPK